MTKYRRFLLFAALSVLLAAAPLCCALARAPDASGMRTSSSARVLCGETGCTVLIAAHVQDAAEPFDGAEVSVCRPLPDGSSRILCSRRGGEVLNTALHGDFLPGDFVLFTVFAGEPYARKIPLRFP